MGMIVALVALVLVVWQHSLDVFFRNDHWWFLFDVREYQHDLFQLVTRTYSYPRTREALPLSRFEFRPMTCLLFAVNQGVFGWNAWGWQAVSLALHAATTVTIYRFARAYLPSSLSFFWALLFGVAFSNAELITWSHIGGYNLFVLFSLGHMIFLKSYLEKTRIKDLISSGMFLFLSCLSVELGVLVAFSSIVTILWFRPSEFKNRIAVIYACLLPVLAYMTINGADYYYRFGGALPASGEVSLRGPQAVPWGQLFGLVPQVLARWIFPMLAPDFQTIEFRGWTYDTIYGLRPLAWFVGSDAMIQMQCIFELVISCIFVTLWLVILVAGIGVLLKSGRKVDRQIGVSLLLSSILLVGAIVFLRGAKDYLLSKRLHYAYLLLSLLFMMTPVFLGQLWHRFALGRWHKVVLTLLASMILFNAVADWTYTERLAQYGRNIKKYLVSIDRIIMTSGPEPIFVRLPKGSDLNDDNPYEDLEGMIRLENGEICVKAPFFSPSILIFHSYIRDSGVPLSFDARRGEACIKGKAAAVDFSISADTSP